MKILVVGPSWVGDMMMSQSLYRTLRARYPQAIIDVMAPAWCRPLLSRMPEVNEAIPMPLGHGALAIGERRKLGHSLRERRYDRAYVLPNSFKSALVPFFANIPHRTGWRGEMRYGLLNDARVLDKDAWPLMVERYVALAYDKGVMLSAKDLPQPLLWPQLQVFDGGTIEGLQRIQHLCRPSDHRLLPRSGVWPGKTLAALPLRRAGKAAYRRGVSGGSVRFGQRP